jgi:hypothetical protein
MLIMQKTLLCFMALILTACNLTAPGSSVEIASPTPGIVVTPDLATSETTPVSGLESMTYRSTKDNYTFEHPASVSVVENTQYGSVDIGDNIRITVMDFNPEESRGDGPMYETASDLMIGESAARRLKGYIGAVGGNIPQSIEQVVIPHNGRFYVIEVSELSHSLPYTSTQAGRTPDAIPASALELFETILSTFRFTV